MIKRVSEYEEKHAGLKENKDHLQTHFRVLRTEMGKQRNKERELLTKLTLASEEALKRQKNIDQKVLLYIERLFLNVKSSLRLPKS